MVGPVMKMLGIGTEEEKKDKEFVGPRELRDMVLEHEDRLNNKVDPAIAEHTDILNRHSDGLNKHSDILTKHSDELSNHSDILTKHSDELTKCSETLTEHDDELKKHSDTLTAHSDAIANNTKDVDDVKKWAESIFKDVFKLSEAVSEIKNVLPDLVNAIPALVDRIEEIRKILIKSIENFNERISALEASVGSKQPGKSLPTTTYEIMRAREMYQ